MDVTWLFENYVPQHKLFFPIILPVSRSLLKNLAFFN